MATGKEIDAFVDGLDRAQCTFLIRDYCGFEVVNERGMEYETDEELRTCLAALFRAGCVRANARDHYFEITGARP